MKITLPNGTVIETDEGITVGGITIEPIVTEPPAEDESEAPEEPEHEEDDGPEQERIAYRLNKKGVYPTEVASLTGPLRDTFRILAQYDNEGGVHSSHVARELNIGLSAANTRCWMLWRRHGVAERVGPGKYRANLID